MGDASIDAVLSYLDKEISDCCSASDALAIRAGCR
jgi:hypothetical protein